MKIYKLLILIFTGSLFESCDNSWDLSELYVLKIENSSKVIYKYDAWGGRDSHQFGYIILDSTAVFDINNINDPLPFQSLEAIPTKMMISGIMNDQSDYTKTSREIFTPLKINLFQNQGIKIKCKIYQYEGFSNRSVGYERYQFEIFKESRDSIFFYNLNDIESLEPKHLDSLKFKKTNILIETNNSDIVSNIRIEDVKLSPKDELISSVNYLLTPKNKIKSSEFSNIGIFKEVKHLKK